MLGHLKSRIIIPILLHEIDSNNGNHLLSTYYVSEIFKL